MGNIFELDTVFIDFKNDTSNLGLDIQTHQNDTLTLNFICTNDGIREDMTKYHVELRVHNNNTNTDYIQTQNENITLGTDGSVRIVCASSKGNKLTAYSGTCNGVLRIFNSENKQKATRIITMRIVADPIQKPTICQSTITKLEELDWILNESYKVETSLKNAIEEAINKKNELIKTTEIASTTNTTLVENIAAGDTLNTNLVTNINEGKTINTTLVTNTSIANEKITILNEINIVAGKNITDLTEQNTNATKNITDLTKQNDDALTNKSELSNILIDATDKIAEVESIISSATGKITEVETSINNADSSKNELDTSNTTAAENIKSLSEKNDTAENLNNYLDKNIKYGSKLNEDLKENMLTGTKVNEILDNIVPKATKIKDDLSAINDLSIKTKDDLTQLNTEALKTKNDLAAENIKADEKIEAMKNIDPANVVQNVTDIKKEVNDARGIYSSLDERITNIIGKDVANLYIGDVEPELDGLWIDTNGVGEVGGNDLLDDLKKYVDNDIKPIIGKIDVEKDGDIASQLKDCAKNIGQLSNPNLLINGDFQVWQRGKDFEIYHKRIYTVDRWVTGSDYGKVKVSKYNGLKFDFLEDGNFIINQQTHPDDLDLRGKTITISALIKSSKPCRLIVFLKPKNGEWVALKSVEVNQDGKTILTCDVPNDYEIFNLEFQGENFVVGDYVNISNVKLELGSVATPSVPRLYVEEEMLCKRYYEKKLMVLRCSNGVDKDLLRVNLSIMYEATKRSIPTVQIHGYNQEKNTIVGKVAFDPTNFPIKIYNNTIYGIGAIDIVELKGKTLNASEMFECYGYEADAEIY